MVNTWSVDQVRFLQQQAIFPGYWMSLENFDICVGVALGIDEDQYDYVEETLPNGTTVTVARQYYDQFFTSFQKLLKYKYRKETRRHVLELLD